MQPLITFAAVYSSGGTGSRSGGPMLSPLKKAASPAHPAGVRNSTSRAHRIASRRFFSTGSAIHCFVASSDASTGAGGLSPWARRAQYHAHHTAGRWGRACARTRTASPKLPTATSRSTYPRPSVPSASRASASSLSSATRQMSPSVLPELRTVVGPGMLVDHRDAAFYHEHPIALDVRHHALDFGLHLTLDAHVQTLDRDPG